MFKASELREKEIINISDGKRLGFVSDIEINMITGHIEAIIIPTENRFLSIFAKEGDMILPWDKIEKIGQDVILVEL